MNKTYKLRTWADIVEMVNKDNLDNFMIDLYQTLDMISKVKDITPEDTWKGVEHPYLTWIDDGEHNIDFELNVEKI